LRLRFARSPLSPEQIDAAALGVERS